jgi:hypothetical protein
MGNTRVKISSIVENQLPKFVQEEFPLAGEFLKQYYISLESQGGVGDILQNIDQYVKVDNLTNLNNQTKLTNDISSFDTSISVESTYGFPDRYGLFQINNEIITYESKTLTSFEGCSRGFSGVTSLKNLNDPSELIFTSSESDQHFSGENVINLSILFLKEFFKKIKTLITPGFENSNFDSDLNQTTFIKQIKDFYSLKGTDESFKILFGALYGEPVTVIKPRDYLISPSNSQYRIVKDIVIESIVGDPFELLNSTIYQSAQYNIDAAYGTVTNVQFFTQNNKNYYVLSLDYDYNKDINVVGSVYGKFRVHPKTKVVSFASTTQSFIDVDSTVGFPNSGVLIANLENGTNLEITYTSKSLNQFFGCSGIDQNLSEELELKLDVYASNYEDANNAGNNLIKFKITGVINDLKFDSDTRYYSEGDEIYTKSLGNHINQQKFKSFLYNISVKYDLETFKFEGNETNLKYSFKTFDENIINIGDNVLLSYIAKIPSGFQQTTNKQIDEIVVVKGINVPKKEFSTITQYQIVEAFSAKRLISKTYFENYPEIDGIYNTNVSNTYIDAEESMYVSSSSLPSYERPIQTKEKYITFAGISQKSKIIYIKDHGFYTGDVVMYTYTDDDNKIVNLSERKYYVERVDSNNIKIYNSLLDIYVSKYSNIATDSSILINSQNPNSNETNKLTLYSLIDKKLETSKIIRKFSSPKESSVVEETKPGFVGLFSNGVEVLNYKSNDSIYYGNIVNIDVIDGGEDYDIVNPPILKISDNVGYGATGNVHVTGTLKRIEIIDPGHDYLEKPIVTITGGNGADAVVEPNLISYNHSVQFNASQYKGNVNLSDDTISFSTYHRFRNYEEVIYETSGQRGIVGLVTDSKYYISILDSNTVKLFKSFNDASIGINTVGLSSVGSGVHTLRSTIKKKKLGSIIVVNEGINYSNKKNIVYSVGISTTKNTIFSKNHGYNDGEIINYSYSSSAISGLSSISYYVTTLNTDEFYLSEIGTGNVDRDFYYTTKQYINLTSSPLGEHIFNYPPIQVNIFGRTGVSTFTPGNQNAIINPVFRGYISTVSLASTSPNGMNIGGVGYGAKEIINYNHQPQIEVISGSSAQLTPIISNGRIVEVIINNGGYKYNCSPNLEIVGTGSGASLTPIISNGSIVKVIVISGGTGYANSTFINVSSSGDGVKLYAKIKEWKINLFEKEFVVPKEGALITPSVNKKNLQFSHLYLPEYLRKILFSQIFFAGDIKYISDFSNDEASASRKNHSPIVGWAYDGNPIYGPYVYSNPFTTTSNITRMRSGYVKNSNLQNDPNRPSFNVGFFVNDFIYKGYGDLDEHNGRYCITPEYPNGVYAYFCSFDADTGYPVFPFVIGNTFKSLPIDFNFLPTSNDDIDLNKTDLKRNTYFYNLNLKTTTYPYIFDSNKIKKQVSTVKTIFSGSVDSIDIKSGGSGYSIGDKIVFDNNGTEGFGAEAKVLTIKGNKIISIGYTSESISNIEFTNYSNSGSVIAICTSPHNFVYGDIVNISGLSTSTTNLYNSFNIDPFNGGLQLISSIGSTSVTGIVTYFNVIGNLNYPQVIENDVFGIGTEKVKVLNIDKLNSRIKVLRCYENTVGSAHSIFDSLFEYSRKFLINQYSLINNYSTNREFYFNPKETLGIGSSFGIGVGTTLYFSNPGSGVTSKFIPTKSLYFKDHNLETGDKLVYTSNGDTQISVSTNGTSTFQLQEKTILYVAKISNDLIGISTFKVGVSSIGSFVGIESSFKTQSTLFLSNVGTGVNHSFKTSFDNVLVGSSNKIISSIKTETNHGLANGDVIDVEIISKISTSIKVAYSNNNSRSIFNPKTFTASNIDLVNNTISINNHSYINGSKIIHISTSPAGGLLNDEIYYVVVVDKDTVKLSNSYYNATLQIPIIVDITTSLSSNGILYEVNPNIAVYKDSTVVFDISDPSLSFTQNSQSYPAFKLEFYTDKKFINKLHNKNIIQNGNYGESGSTLSLIIDNFIPSKIYYKLIPFNPNKSIQIPVLKESIIVDSENISENNTITIKESKYSGINIISGITSDTILYYLNEVPEYFNYSDINSILNYNIIKGVVNGPINSISIVNNGKNYKTLPGISSVVSDYGSGAILIPVSNSIGKIKSVSIGDYGFDYSVDKTITPKSSLPLTLKIDPFNSVDKIVIVSAGKNYTSSPNLILIDGFTNKVVDDIVLDYSIKTNTVTVVKNTTGIYNSTPRIIPTNNSNGMKIKNIGFSTTTKNVTVTLDVGFLSGFSTSTDFPFLVGDKILIENTSVYSNYGEIVYKGYNSKNYNYDLFTITSTDPNIGGVNPSIVFNLSNYLNGDELPGSFNPLKTTGKIIAEKDFPLFDIKLKKNTFFKDEKIVTETSEGFAQKFDDKNEYLKISTRDVFNIGEIILGKTTGSKAIITNIISYDSNYIIDATSIVKSGSKKETGFLNYNNQRLHDNDYYQYFSYSLSSNVPYDQWNMIVDSSNHTSGFKKFSDLVINSTPTNVSGLCNTLSGICTDQNSGSVITTADIFSQADVNCVYDFDLASENSIDLDNNIISNEIIFNSKVLQNYIEASGNIVLKIDDISSSFDNTPRDDVFSIVDTFNPTSSRYKKYFVLIEDTFFDEIKEFSIVSLLHNESIGFINQYGKLSTSTDLGSFDFRIFGSEAQLLYYPSNSSVNDYNISYVTYSLDNIVAIGTTSLGNIVNITSHYSQLNVGYASTTIVGIASTYRAAKILVKISSTNGVYDEVDEITILNDGNNIHLIDYGQLDTSRLSALSISGLGTYYAYIVGNRINIDLIPNVAITTSYSVNSISVSIASTQSIGIGTYTLPTGKLKSSYISIPAAASPIQNIISSISLPEKAAYCLASIENTTNNKYQVSEIAVINDGVNGYIVDFGNLETQSGIGTFSTSILGNTLNINFTPLPNIKVDVRVFTNSITPANTFNSQQDIDLGSSTIDHGFGFYTGTSNDIKKSFYITHKNLPIFHRFFDGSSNLTVDISNNVIKIPDHFFRTGEKITYFYDNYQYSSENAIGIGTTYISVGVGTTDKLPRNLYIVKVDNYSIQLATSAQNALKLVPDVINLTSVGIGTNHKFSSDNENNRVLISIDNVIQSPLVSTATTSILLDNIDYSNSLIKISNISDIFPEDLIKINDEVMKVNAVGVGSTNIVRVQRRSLGSILDTHNLNSLVSKVEGSYNLVDNVINFVEPPYGPSPIGTVTNSADERDYIGITTASTFNGRVFMRSSAIDSTNDPYALNYIFDDISSSFSGIKSDFQLKVSGSNVTAISSSNLILLINGIFQGPENSDISPVVGNYYLQEYSGITSVYFKGTGISTTYDINTSGLPFGGIIVLVGSTNGLGYQPLVAAGGTAVVSSAGTIQSISIGNSGSGYRSGVQVVNVGVTTSDLETPNIKFVGTATVSNGNIVSVAITSPGTGYTSTNPPLVIFDSPLSYQNIPLIYSNPSSSGIGTEAKVNIVVGQGSSVISFELINYGYNYKFGDILTIPVGGSTGIPTDPTKPFSNFNILVNQIYTNKFSAWSIGDLQIVDDFSNEFNNIRKSFQLKIDNMPISIIAAKNSNIDLSSTLLVFINDILQVPGESYIFEGGSIITFTEAPKSSTEFWGGDQLKIYFYRGTSDVDTKEVDIIESIKVGDGLQLYGKTLELVENERIVDIINSSNSVITNTYVGPGITEDEFLLRPVIWCRQTVDRIINGKLIGKDRELYEPNIEPTTSIIQSVGIGSTIIFVENVKSFFDNQRENASNKFISKIKIISQKSKVGAYATAIVSNNGEISNIDIISGGVGYTTSPNIIISNPVGFGSTATFTTTIINGSVSGITTIGFGSNYSQINPPSVLIEHPLTDFEIIENVLYEGDFGVISGISTGSIVGVASTALIFDLLIKNDSFLRDSNIVGTAITISTIKSGYYFVIKNSNIGYGVTSLDEYGNIVGVGKSFLDNVYKVASVSIARTDAVGIGQTYVAKVIVPIKSYNSLTGFGYSGYYGEYSWGRISFQNGSRKNQKSFNVNTSNGIVGLETSPIVKRFNPLRYIGYST